MTIRELIAWLRISETVPEPFRKNLNDALGDWKQMRRFIQVVEAGENSPQGASVVLADLRLKP